jgi:hypothetical protein
MRQKKSKPRASSVPSAVVTVRCQSWSVLERCWRDVEKTASIADSHRDTPVDVFAFEPFPFDAEYAAALVKPLADGSRVPFVSLMTLIRRSTSAASKTGLKCRTFDCRFRPGTHREQAPRGTRGRRLELCDVGGEPGSRCDAERPCRSRRSLQPLRKWKTSPVRGEPSRPRDRVELPRIGHCAQDARPSPASYHCGCDVGVYLVAIAINTAGSVTEGSISGAFGDRKPPSSAYATLSPKFHRERPRLFVGGNFREGRATGAKLGNPAADQAQGPFLNPAERALPDAAFVVYRVSVSR